MNNGLSAPEFVGLGEELVLGLEFFSLLGKGVPGSLHLFRCERLAGPRLYLGLLLLGLLLLGLHLGEAGKFYRGFGGRFETGALGEIGLLRETGERRRLRCGWLFWSGRGRRGTGWCCRRGCFGYRSGFSWSRSGFFRRYTNFFFNPSPRWFNCCSWSTAPTFAIFMRASSTDKRWFLLPL
jgi:hypothetical protein